VWDAWLLCTTALRVGVLIGAESSISERLSAGTSQRCVVHGARLARHSEANCPGRMNSVRDAVKLEVASCAAALIVAGTKTHPLRWGVVCLFARSQTLERCCSRSDGREADKREAARCSTRPLGIQKVNKLCQCIQGGGGIKVGWLQGCVVNTCCLHEREGSARPEAEQPRKVPHHNAAAVVVRPQKGKFVMRTVLSVHGGKGLDTFCWGKNACSAERGEVVCCAKTGPLECVAMRTQKNAREIERHADIENCTLQHHAVLEAGLRDVPCVAGLLARTAAIAITEALREDACRV
jgi:hypothetical protein